MIDLTDPPELPRAPTSPQVERFHELRQLLVPPRATEAAQLLRTQVAIGILIAEQIAELARVTTCQATTLEDIGKYIAWAENNLRNKDR